MSTDLLAAIESLSDPVAFERLCCDVLSRLGYLGIDPQGIGRRDAGKDALLTHPTFGRVVFHFSLRADWERKLREDLETASSRGIECDQIVFFTNRRVPVAAKDTLKSMVKNSLGCELEIFGQERLRSVLFADDKLMAEYFPKYLVVGNVLPQLASMLSSLVANGLIVPHPDQLNALPDVVRSATDAAARGALLGNSAHVLENVKQLTKTLNAIRSTGSEGLLMVGGICHQQGLYDTAEEVWRQAIVVDPDSFAARFNIAVNSEYDDTGRRYGPHFEAEKTITAYQVALAFATNAREAADCLDNWGVVLVRADQLEEAAAKFDEAIEKFPEHARARLNRATLFEDFQSRCEAFRSLLDTPVDTFARFNLAKELAAEREFESARELVEGIEPTPDVPATYGVLCRIELGLGSLEAATEHVGNLVRYDFQNPSAHALLGDVAETRGDLAEMAAAYETALELDPENPKYLTRLADALYHESPPIHLDRVIALLVKAVTLDPSYGQAHLNLGLAYSAKGMTASAAVEFRRTTELRPSSPLGHFNLGYLAETGPNGVRYSDPTALRLAVRHYERALEADPEYDPALTNIGICHLALGRPTKAIEYFLRADSVSPDHPIVLANLITAYQLTGKLHEALRCTARLAKISSERQQGVNPLRTDDVSRTTSG